MRLRYDAKLAPGYRNIFGIWDFHEQCFVKESPHIPLRFADEVALEYKIQQLNDAEKVRQRKLNDVEFDQAC
jgi:hypothetical protein